MIINSSGIWISAIVYAIPADQIICFSMSVDESGRRLGAIHESGSISVWLLPGLFLDKQVNLSEQPAFDEVNPQLLQVPGSFIIELFCLRLLCQ